MVITNFFTAADFETILNDFGRQIIHVPVVKTDSNISGKEILTESSPVVIEAYFMRSSQNWDYEEAGFFEKGDAVCLGKYADNVTQNDLIYADGINVELSAIDGNATTISITTSSAHGLSIDDGVIVLGTTNYDGVYVVATVPDSTHITITDNAHDLAAETSGQLNKSFIKFRIKQSFNVNSVFDNTGGANQFIYSANNLFIEDDAQ